MNFQLLNILILVTVFLVPLIGATSNFGYEQIKVLFFIVLTSLIGFVWLFTKPKLKWNLIKTSSAVFILMLFVTAALGVDPKISFLGSEPYFQGWILYAYLFLFSLMVSQAKIRFKFWAYVLVGSSMIVGFIAIKDWVLLNVLGQQIPTYAGRVVFTFGQPNFYAGFILLTLPFFRLRGFWVTLGFLISILAIILSGSRVAWLGTAGLVLFWLILELPFRKLVFGLTFFALLIIFVISIIFSAGWVEKELILLKATNNPDLPTIGVEKRYYFWPILGTLFLEKPLAGYGLENIAPVFFKYFEKNKHALFEENLKVQPYLFGLKDLNLDRSHNYILDLLLFSGVLGLLWWLGLVVVLFKKLGQTYNDRIKFVLLTSLVVYLIWIQFQNQSVVHLIYFWLLVGMVDSQA